MRSVEIKQPAFCAIHRLSSLVRDYHTPAIVTFLGNEDILCPCDFNLGADV